MDTGTKNYAVVLVDDNPLTTWALRRILRRIGKKEGMSLYMQEATSIDMALPIIAHISRFYSISYIFLNLQMASVSDGTMIPGENLASAIHRKSPRSKLILSTSYSSPYHIYALLDEVSPAGLIVKKDMKEDMSFTILRSVILYPPYFSPTVARIISKGEKHRYLLNKWDRLILHEISQRTSLTDLVAMLPMSRSTILRHKEQLKLHLGLSTTADDRTLILAARKEGLI